jgi:hypothetical protein
VFAQTLPESLHRKVDQLGELLDRSAELPQILEHGRLPPFDRLQLGRGAVSDLRALTVQLVELPGPVRYYGLVVDGGRGELREQLVLSAAAGRLLRIEPIAHGRQPRDVLLCGRRATCSPWPRSGALPHHAPADDVNTKIHASCAWTSMHGAHSIE